MYNIFFWIIFGFVAGGLAKLIMPGTIRAAAL
jgi:uncharacterized membrane protein YeaQ/YmgE (transglycosylase-associated protein family)